MKRKNTAERDGAEIDLMAIEFYTILAHQQGAINDPQRFKAFCQGRRDGKDRLMLYASLFGHGPLRRRTGTRRWPGIIHGGDVVWLAPDFTQGKGIWNEEVVPRFGSLPDDVCHLDRKDLELTIHGAAGKLYFRSFLNIDSVRGLGSNIVGLIINEAAWFDLQHAWLHILRPVLADNMAWAMIASTANSGTDGNKDKRVPSFFNMLCDQIALAAAGDAEARKRRHPHLWRLFEGDARDNPVISRAEFDELVNEYPDGSVALEEEVYARRLPPGGRRRAVPQFSRKVHVIEPFTIPAHWPRFAAFDWGFIHFAVFGGFAVDEDGNLYLEDTLWMRGMLPDKQAHTVRMRWNPEVFVYVHAGHDCWAEHKAHAEDIPTIAESFSDEDIELSKANIDRAMGMAAMQDVFGYEERGPGGTAGDPRIYIMRTPGNLLVCDQLESMLTDEKQPRKPEVKDADPRTGLGGDDGFTMLRYAIASRRDGAPSLTADPVSAAWDESTLAGEAHRSQLDAVQLPDDLDEGDTLADMLGLVNPGL